MEVILGILLAVAVVAAVLMGLQVTSARSSAAKAASELDGLRSRLAAIEAEMKKSSDTLESKRKESEELKERLKDVKKRRHEEKEAARLKQDIERAREEIEREMEKKLQAAREEAEISKAQVKKLGAEIESLKARRPAPVQKAPEPKAAQAAEAKAESPQPETPRELAPEEKARLEAAEKQLAVARRKVEELQEEVKKVRARSETDRRVFLVQKGELEVAKDKFRALEARFNSVTLERDELKKAVWLLEKELKSLKPVPEHVASEAVDSGTDGHG